MHVSDGHSLLHFETVPMRPSDVIDPIMFTEIKKFKKQKSQLMLICKRCDKRSHKMNFISQSTQK